MSGQNILDLMYHITVIELYAHNRPIGTGLVGESLERESRTGNEMGKQDETGTGKEMRWENKTRPGMQEEVEG